MLHPALAVYLLTTEGAGDYDPAVMSTDPGAHIRPLLQTLARQSGAGCAVLFFPRGRDVVIGPEFVRDTAPAVALQVAFDTTALAWGSARYRSELVAGRHIRLRRAVLWPLYEDGRLAGVVYLDQAPPPADFPSDRQRQFLQRIHNHALRCEVPHPVRSYLEELCVGTDVRGELERLQLEEALRAHRGNVSAVARRLRISRETVYARLQRCGLVPSVFRSTRRPSPAPASA